MHICVCVCVYAHWISIHGNCYCCWWATNIGGVAAAAADEWFKMTEWMDWPRTVQLYLNYFATNELWKDKMRYNFTQYVLIFRLTQWTSLSNTVTDGVDVNLRMHLWIIQRFNDQWTKYEQTSVRIYSQTHTDDPKMSERIKIIMQKKRRRRGKRKLHMHS